MADTQQELDQYYIDMRITDTRTRCRLLSLDVTGKRLNGNEGCDGSQIRVHPPEIA